MSALTLQLLIDRAEISDVFSRYAVGIDTRDWALWRTCFTEDVELDATSVFPGLVHHGIDQLVAGTKQAVEGLDATQHIITNHTHDIQGDTAKCTSYLHAQHVYRNNFGGGHHILAGYYKYDMVRTRDGWKIKKYSLTITWGTGDGAVWSLAQERLKNKQGHSSA